jgi:hypothetical protein
MAREFCKVVHKIYKTQSAIESVTSPQKVLYTNFQLLALRHKSSPFASTEGETMKHEKRQVEAASNDVLATENQADRDALFDEYNKMFCPVNLPELELVEQIVSARWRLRRLHSMETEIFDMRIEEHGMFNKERHEKRTPKRKEAVAFQSLANTTQTLTQLSSYESRLERSYERAVANLNKLRALPTPPKTTPKLFLVPPPEQNRDRQGAENSADKTNPGITRQHSHPEETSSLPPEVSDLYKSQYPTQTPPHESASESLPDASDNAPAPDPESEPNAAPYCTAGAPAPNPAASTAFEAPEPDRESRHETYSRHESCGSSE